MAETTTTLEKHFSKVVSTGRTVHDFIGGDGNRYSTFKAEVAEKVIPLVGQLVTLEYTEQTNGDFTNYYIQGAKPANGVAPRTLGETNQVLSASGSVDALGTPTDPRQQSIQRQTAIKASVELAANGYIEIGQLWTMADQILDWIEGRSAI